MRIARPELCRRMCVLAVGACTVLGSAVVLQVAGGCEDKGPAEKAGEKVDKAIDKTGDAVKKAGDKVKDAANK